MVPIQKVLALESAEGLAEHPREMTAFGEAHMAQIPSWEDRPGLVPLRDPVTQGTYVDNYTGGRH